MAKTSCHSKRNKYSVVLSYLRDYLASIAPGVLDFLELFSYSSTGKPLEQILSESPCTLYRLFIEIYGSATAKHIITNLILLPLTRLENPLAHSIYSKLSHCIEENEKA